MGERAGLLLWLPRGWLCMGRGVGGVLSLLPPQAGGVAVPALLARSIL